MTATYLLADVPVLITSLYDEVHQMCAPYATDLPAQIHITTSHAQIEAEGMESDETRRKEGLPELHFPAPYLETLAVYRQLATQLLDLGVLLMHGSVIAVDGEGYLFTAPSGTGKSTHVRLWRELFGERAVMINDDKPLIRVDATFHTPHSASDVQHCSLVYGTPWDGKHHLSTNTSVPLRAIIHLHRGDDNHIEPTTPAEMLPTLLQQTFSPDTAVGTIQILSLIDGLSKHVRFYSLHCNMQPDAALIAYEGMR